MIPANTVGIEPIEATIDWNGTTVWDGMTDSEILLIDIGPLKPDWSDKTKKLHAEFVSARREFDLEVNVFRQYLPVTRRKRIVRAIKEFVNSLFDDLT